METTVEEKPTTKRGNPNFKPKFRPFEPNAERTYEFELINTVDQGKPVDKENNQPLDAPYPRVFTRPNEGNAWDEETNRVRAWRYIVGQPSIWVDEQVQLEKMEARDISALLGREENQIEFVRGKCSVRGIEKLKLHALVIHDAFETKTRQLKEVPRLYRLINPDKDIEKVIDSGDLEFKALKLAYEADDDAMLRASFALGIPVDDLSKYGKNKIRVAFRARAKYDANNPKAKEALELFISIMENPLTKIKYIFAQGFKQSIISYEQVPGKLTWSVTQTPILDLAKTGSAIDQLSGMVIDRNELAMTVFEEIEKQLDNMAE